MDFSLSAESQSEKVKVQGDISNFWNGCLTRKNMNTVNLVILIVPFLLFLLGGTDSGRFS